MVSKFGAVLSCVAALTLSSVAFAQRDAVRLGFSPVQVGAGPLLFFVHPQDASGASLTPVGRRYEALYVVDPENGLTPQLVWRGEEPRTNPEPLARIGNDLIVFEHGHTARLLSLARGVERRLLPTFHDTEFLGAQGDRIYFLARQVREARGHGLQSTDKDGRNLSADASRPKDRLYSMRADFDAVAERFGEIEIERLLEVDSRGFYAVQAGAQRSLAYFGYDGRVDPILAVPSTWDVSELFMKFSPDRRFLAFSILPSDYDRVRERLLLVLEYTSRRTIAVRERVHASQFRGWGILAPLPLEWLDATHLWAVSDSFVFDVEKNVELNAATADALRARAFDDFSRRRGIGSFDLDGGILLYDGEFEPIDNDHRDYDPRAASIRELEVSACGRWAAFVHPETNHTSLVDGTHRRVSVLFDGSSYDIKWLVAHLN